MPTAERLARMTPEARGAARLAQRAATRRWRLKRAEEWRASDDGQRFLARLAAMNARANRDD